jgi:mono/diheme cytochrome c family protein
MKIAIRFVVIVGLVVASSARADDQSIYDKEVAPLLKAHCLKCHGAEAKIKGGLRLTSREDVLKGGDTGPAVVLDKPDESLLLKAVHYKGDLQMPPSGKLPDKEIEVLTRWVKAGVPMTATAPSKPVHDAKPIADGKDYWAYQPIKRPEPPAVKNSDWARNAIDAFILAKLEAKGLAPNPPADPVAFIRRITYDLTGLPPTPEEIDAFVNSPIANPNAKIELLVDRLLASPHYGERWGRHWLDVVRYAESNGYERDGPKPFVWRYRDYVIRSFNSDKPYDRFVREQLAGDEMPAAGTDGIIATGYYRLGLWDDEPVDPQQALFDGYDDIVATTGQVFLGMTLNCCRCHDHKIDPLPQTDYYRMVAFFRDIRPFSDTRDVRSRFNLTDISPPDKRKVYEAELAARQTRRDELKKDMKPLEDAAIA